MWLITDLTRPWLETREGGRRSGTGWMQGWGVEGEDLLALSGSVKGSYVLTFDYDS